MGLLSARVPWHGLVTVVATLSCAATLARAQLTRVYADTRVPEGGDAIFVWGVLGNTFDDAPDGGAIEQVRIDAVNVRVRLVRPSDGAVICDGADAASSSDYSSDIVFGNALQTRRTDVGEGWIRLDFVPAVSAIGAWVFDAGVCCSDSTRMRVFGQGGVELGLTPIVDGHAGIGVGVDGFLGAVDATGQGITSVIFECVDGDGVASTRYAIDHLQLRRWRPFVLNAPSAMLSCVDSYVTLASTPFPANGIWWEAFLPETGFVALGEGPTSVATFWGGRYEFLTCSQPIADELRIRARIQVGDGLMLTSDETVIDVLSGQTAAIASSPQSQNACVGETVELAATADGAAPVVMQWQIQSSVDESTFVSFRNGAFIDPISGKSLLVSGVLDPALHLTLGPEWLPGETVTVAAWASNLCGGELSQAAVITVDAACDQCPACAADFDQDGGITGGDIASFLGAWEVGNACADVDEDGGVTGSDLGAFFAVFEVGGC